MRTFVFSAFVVLLSGCYTCEESVRKQYINNNISGVVVRKEHMREGRKSGFLDIEQGGLIELFTIANDDETGLVEITEIGDSLFKEKGDQYLHIYRNGILVKKYNVWNECKYSR